MLELFRRSPRTVKTLDRQCIWACGADDEIVDPFIQPHKHTSIVFQELFERTSTEERIYVCKLSYGQRDYFPNKGEMSTIDPRALAGSTPLLRSMYLPLAPPGLRIVDLQISQEAIDQIALNFLEEALVCERIANNPHQNLANYLGAQVINGRISGLCFERYENSLLDKSGCSSNQERARIILPEEEREEIMDQITEGLAHLASFGLIHTCITPSKIMFQRQVENERESFVVKIVGFDCCRERGTELKEWMPRQGGWYTTPDPPDLPKATLENHKNTYYLEKWMEDDYWASCRSGLPQGTTHPHPL
ncbi:hypothetical protein BDV97DRAFT_195281 [Delphinella strobiligena]|nr:hypothetical protein BDV97DRAFT_195281 [Delphinella strobiligena]